MATTSPQPLTPQLVSDYRTIMTRVDPSDWDALRRRVDAASRLAARAFLEKDRAAWEVVQVVEWRIQRSSSLRPTDPGDVLVLDAMYRTEESANPAAELPRGLTPRQFCDKLTEDIAVYSSIDSPTIELLSSDRLTKEDWEYFAYQWLAPTGDFTRMIAIASLPLPHSFSRFMYHNLFDEAGRGEWERSHHFLLLKFLSQFGIVTDDEETLLYWTVPDHLAMINVQNRMLWHREAGWGLGSMYLYERLLPSELALVRKGLLSIGVPKESLAWFDEHIVVDVQHAEDWIGVVESFIRDYDDQKIAYQAALERGRWARAGWDAMYEGWRTWKETGVPPHVPARELREATGL